MQVTATGGPPGSTGPERPRRLPRAVRTTAALAAGLLVLATAACSDDSDQDDSDQDDGTAPGGADSEAPETVDGGGSSDRAAPDDTDGTAGDGEAEAAPQEPLATVDGPGAWTSLEITDLRRVQDTVTLEFVLVVETSEALGTSTEDAFAAPQDRLGEGDVGGFDRTPRQSVSGATLVDVTNNQRHLVLRDSEGACLCTSFLSPFAESGRYPHSAQFAAPPDDVTAMTVQIPAFPVVDSVPLRTAD